MTRLRRLVSLALMAALACMVLALPVMAGSVRHVASLVPAAAAAPALDAQSFNLLVAVVIGAASSYALKWAPASWKGKPMVAVAIVVSIALEGAELYVTGQLATFSLSNTADILAAIAGQATFFALLKDDLQLQDPPAPKTSTPTALPGIGAPH